MSSTYTAVPGNIGAIAPVTVTIPADGDALSVASVNAALQKLADYVAYLETKLGTGVAIFGCSTSPADTTLRYLLPGGPYAVPTSQSQYFKSSGATFRIISMQVIAVGPTTQGQTFTVTDPSGTPSTCTCFLAAGVPLATDTTHHPVVSDGIAVSIQGTAGITVGASTVVVAVAYALN